MSWSIIDFCASYRVNTIYGVATNDKFEIYKYEFVI